MYKSCKTCNETKNINEFVKDKGKKDGHRNRCKKCENLKRRKTPIKPQPREGYKYCASCGEEKLLNNFNVRFILGKYRPFSYCKPCERKKDTSRYSHECAICKKKYKSGRKDNKICADCYITHVFKTDKNPNILSTIDFSGKNNPMYGKQRFGKENPNYNPDKTDEDRNNGRLIEGYGIWRRKVYERDNFICQCCGYSKGGTLIAHHLDGYSWCVEKRTDVDNGVTLCETCHNKFHAIYGLRNNTKEQFITYKNNQEYLL
ncbi:TPA: HNH endonuclease [Bacillus thuringiensis]|nr:HNH endonuclease [Bacillus thuringiensis]